MAQPMESGTLICKCKKVTYGMIEDAMHHHNDLGDVVKLFEEVQKETSCLWKPSNPADQHAAPSPKRLAVFIAVMTLE